MNVQLRPAPTRVNAILGCPCVMVQNGYCKPIFFLLTRGIVFRTLLGFRSGEFVGVGGGGARGVYVAHGLIEIRIQYSFRSCSADTHLIPLYCSMSLRGQCQSDAVDRNAAHLVNIKICIGS